MLIETPKAIYESFIKHVQIEVTGRCNMRCMHCRASDQSKEEMSLGTAKKILEFAAENSTNDWQLVISGGEPFLYPYLIDIVFFAKKLKAKNIVITTNGSLIQKYEIAKLQEVSDNGLYIQISIDSPYPEKHNNFRSHKGAFEAAVKGIEGLVKAGLNVSVRATLTAATIDEIEQLIQFAKSLGVSRIAFGSVIPAGRGKQNIDLLFNKEQKKKFLEDLTVCKIHYPEIKITTEDPLKFAINKEIWDYGGFDYKSPDFFGGCTAGVTGFNANSDGIITPCSVLQLPIVNAKNKTLKQIYKAYVLSPVIRNLAMKEFKGKCGSCALKRLCGGCRAIAAAAGDYLGEDSTCWRNKRA